MLYIIVQLCQQFMNKKTRVEKIWQLRSQQTIERSRFHSSIDHVGNAPNVRENLKKKLLSTEVQVYSFSIRGHNVSIPARKFTFG